MNHSAPLPRMLGLFQKRIAGDDALLELARLRFQQTGLAAEIHAATGAELDWMLKFRPSANLPVVVHLPREFDLLFQHHREQIAALAAHVPGQVYGFVLHDHQAMVSQRTAYRRAAQELDSRLREIDGSPILFIEYAAGLAPDQFADFFSSIRDQTRISACIDVGHVGIREIRRAFAARHQDADVCALKQRTPLPPELLVEIEAAVSLALPRVLSLITTLGALGKPLHFHLHDGHPLSTFSPFGVSDHLSFFGEIPLSVAFKDRRSLPLMFGPAGLAQIVERALEVSHAEQLSFTLEIHPTGDRLPLGDAASLFDHWRDKTNAEKMNHWLHTLTQNHRLLGKVAGESMLRRPRSS